MGDLKLTKTSKIMMMGTPEEQQLVEPEEKFDVPPSLLSFFFLFLKAVYATQILDDFEYDPANVHLKDREENIRKIQSRIDNVRLACLG